MSTTANSMGKYLQFLDWWQRNAGFNAPSQPRPPKRLKVKIAVGDAVSPKKRRFGDPVFVVGRVEQFSLDATKLFGPGGLTIGAAHFHDNWRRIGLLRLVGCLLAAGLRRFWQDFNRAFF